MLVESASTAFQHLFFPSSEMLERIAAALNFDSPELFASKTFRDDVIKNVQERINADLDRVTHTIYERLSELKNTTINVNFSKFFFFVNLQLVILY
jgi:hypothetical protein